MTTPFATDAELRDELKRRLDAGEFASELEVEFLSRGVSAVRMREALSGLAAPAVAPRRTRIITAPAVPLREDVGGGSFLVGFVLGFVFGWAVFLGGFFLISSTLEQERTRAGFAVGFITLLACLGLLVALLAWFKAG